MQKYNLTTFAHVLETVATPRAVTWEQFIATTKAPIIAPKEQVPLFCPFTFANNKRSKENAIEGSMLVLDVDEGATLADDWGFVREWGFTCAIYTTPSHQRVTEKHSIAHDRFRLVFPLLTPVDGETYERLWLWANAHLGGMLDQQTKFRNALYYKPAKHDENAPYFADNIAGDLLDWTVLDLPQLSERKPAHIPRDFVPTPQVGRYDKGAQQEFDRQVNAVRNASNGTKHVTLNAGAFYLGRFVGAGRLDKSDVENSLYSAVVSAGAADTKHAEYTIRRAVGQGALDPLWSREAPTKSTEPKATVQHVIEEKKQRGERLYARMDEMRDRMYAGEFRVASVPTGIQSIDMHLFKGGLPRKEITVLSGLSGGGKSTTALQIMKSMVDAGSRVLVFPYEMNYGQIMGRFIGYCCGLKFWDWESAYKNEQWQYGERLFNHYVESDKIIFLSEADWTDIDYIEAATAQATEDGIAPDCVIIDHNDHITGGTGEADIKKRENISKRLKTVGRKNDCAMLLLSQVNKASQFMMERGEKVRGSALRGTGSLYHDARLVLIIESVEEDGIKHLSLHIDKQSYGQSGIEIPLSFHDSFFSFQGERVINPVPLIHHEIPEF